MSSLSVCISQNDSWSEIALLDGLSSGELSYLRRVTYQKNFSVSAHVLCVGQTCDNVYVVLHGALKVCSRPQSEPDKIVIHDLVGRGEVLGEMAALDGCSRWLQSF